MELERREKHEQQNQKRQYCAAKVICVPIGTGSATDDDHNFRVRGFFDFANSPGQRVGSSLIESFAAHD